MFEERSVDALLESEFPGAAPGLPEPPSALVGKSAKFRHALRDLPAIGETDSPVLLLGETGTGKELMARSVHAVGPRRTRPFVAINCASIPAELVESELFGHSAGAFSGAARAKRGLVELADGGTLFLDEIGEMPPVLQAKLLRVLDDREVRRVGETETRRVDFRLVAATNRDIERDVEAGRFRRDLFHRINIFIINLPPLRERAEDIAELAGHFAVRAAERLGRSRPLLSPASVEALERHAWPGNVRELANVMERAVALSRDRTIEPWHLGARFTTVGASTARRGSFRARCEQFERELIAEAMAESGGNVSAAARGLAIARQQLQRLLRRHGLGNAATA